MELNEDKKISDLEKIKEELFNLIIKLNKEYDGSKEKYDELEKMYNLFHRVCDVLTEKKGTYQGGSVFDFTNVSPCVFVVDAKPKHFDLDEEVLKSVSCPKEVYSLEEAETLIKWTVNNTRNNLASIDRTDNLIGVCGFSQFSSLYPLEKLGLKITINNASSFGGGRHAFGTVTIPVDIDGKVLNKQYLIDCTYSQFYILYNCVEEMYSKNGRTPDAGYFIKDDMDKKRFVEDMITDGYCEFNVENMKKYAYGLYMSTIPKDKVEEASVNFEKIDFINIINNEVEEFKDFDEEEFLELGLNLEIEKKIVKEK